MAEFVGFVDAQDCQFAGEELKFFQREAHRTVFGVAFYVSVELGGVEGAAELMDSSLVMFTPLVAKPPIAL